MSRNHPDWLSAYAEYASHSEAPDKFHFWTAVSTVCGALRRRVWIDQAYFQWTPNMYIVFVAPPGIVSKSTTASIGMRLLRQLPDVNFGPDAVTWQALTEGLAGSTEEVPYIDKSTGEETFLPMSCLTISSSEFGTFLDPNDRAMVDALVSLWDGQLGVWEKSTKTAGDDTIVNPWINMIACTTPAWIAGNFPEYMIGGGFTSRCVFVYGEEKRRLVAYPGDSVPTNMADLELSLVQDLEKMSLLTGPYVLTPEATAFGTEWYAQHYAETRDSIDNRAIGYRARKQTHVHKLAMVLAASQRDELIITQEDLERSVRLVSDLEAEMPKVFQLIGRTDGARWTDAVLDVVSKSGAIDHTLLIRHLAKTLSLREINEGISACVAAGYIEQRMVEGRLLVFRSDKQIEPKTPPSEVYGADSSQAFRNF